MSEREMEHQPAKPVSLFDLFRTTSTYIIKDASGRQSEVCFRSLDWVDESALRSVFTEATKRGQAEAESKRPEYQKQAEILTAEQLIEILMVFESQGARSAVDLAAEPPAKTEEERAAQEAALLVRWKTERQAELAKEDLSSLQTLLVDRQIGLFATSYAVNEWTEHQLAAMVVDPGSLEPIFSTTPAERNYIGRLQPETRRQLLARRSEFLKPTEDATVRATVTDPGFLSPGALPKPSADIPGETTEIPPDSPLTSSPPTASVNG